MVGAILGMAVFAASAAVGTDSSEFVADVGIGLVVGGAIGTVGGLLTAVLSLLVKGIVDPVLGVPDSPTTASRDARIAGVIAGALALVGSALVLMDDGNLGVRLVAAVLLPAVVGLTAARIAAWIWRR